MTSAQESLVLRGGIIAAGHGTRLRADGYRVSKPMTPVDGRPLIGHALDRFRAAGVRQASIIINEGSDDCRHWLSEHGRDLDLDLIVRTTPSSYASFEIVAARLVGAPALITTVDAVMPVGAFHHFVSVATSLSQPAFTGSLRIEARSRKRVSTVCATISNGWSIRGDPSTASFCPSCLTSIGRTTSRPPSRPGFAGARTPAHEHWIHLLGRAARAEPFAWADR
jgi:GTP:adenosylcobinamide-phosphate guanylyltransferase